MRGTGVCVVIAVHALAGAGCFEPQLQTDLPCANGLCPEGQDCVDGVCRPEGFVSADGPLGTADAAPQIDGNPFLDSDGDGFSDDVDNCDNIPNNQHDEDADGNGDVCDRCPHLAMASADTDGDGIGDLCDPRPMNNADVLDRFYGFDVV